MGITNKITLYKYNKKINNIYQCLYQYIPNWDKTTNKKDMKQNIITLHHEAQKPHINPSIVWADIIASIYWITNKKLYKEQLCGAMGIVDYKIIEMKTGEGKTLAGLAATLFIILTHRSPNVFIVTTNEYLANRDYLSSLALFDYYGIFSSVVLETDSLIDKKQKYTSQVIYLTDEQLGFDYLRDMNNIYNSHIMLPKLNFVLIDEVDNILLDNARTPLILSSGEDNSRTGFNLAQQFVNSLKSDDYTVDKEFQEVYLTSNGEEKLAKFKTNNKNEVINFSELLISINISLRANFLMQKDHDYIVQDDKIIILNNDTGRLSRNRRYNNGLSNALEVKESIPLTKENEINQRITYQSLFLLFRNFSGMTGTAYSSKKEFRQLYGKDVLQIPAHFKLERHDYPDKLYINSEKRDIAVLQLIRKLQRKNIPVLVQTTSIEENRRFSEFLFRHHIKYQSFTGISISDKNSDNYEKEKEIVDSIGRSGHVTVATNIAGRGTDIKLSDKNSELAVIGISRSHNKRLDEQFIGRSGRQGKKGSSQFFLSLDDPLIKDFARKGLLNNINQLKIKQSKKVATDGLIKGRLNKIVRQAEGSAADIDLTQRQYLAEYNRINETIRENIYHIKQCFLNNSIQKNKIVLKRFALNNLKVLNSDLSSKIIKNQLVLNLNHNSRVKLSSNCTNTVLLQQCQTKIIKWFKYADDKQIKRLQDDLLRNINFFWQLQLGQFEDDQIKTMYTNYLGIDPISKYADLAFKQKTELIDNLYKNLIYDILLS